MAVEYKLFEVNRYKDGSSRFVGGRDVVLKTLNRFRYNSGAEFCDIALEVQGRCLNAHRCVLAASSQYFYSLFTIGMDDSHKRKIELNHLSSKAVETILDYLYTHFMTINLENVDELLEAADFLLLDPIKEACTKVLIENLSQSNWYSYKLIAERYALLELKKKAEDFITKSFCAVVRGDINVEFLDLPVEAIADVISRDELMVEKEDDVYFSVLNWVRHDTENRKSCLSELLSLLRYDSLSNEFLQQQLEKEPVLIDSPHCSTLIEELMSSINKAERSSTKDTCVIVGVNGLEAVCYDVETNTSHSLPGPDQIIPVDTMGYLLSVCIVQNTVYANFTRPVPDVSFVKCSLASYDKPLQWQELPQCNIQRAERDDWHMVTLNGLVYVIGGDVSNGAVECFDPQSNRWSQVASLQSPRRHFQVVATESHTFAIGGVSSSGRLLSQQSVEKYCPVEDKWEYAATSVLLRITSGFDAAVYVRGKIFAFRDDRPISCNVYNPSEDQWYAVSSCMSVGDIEQALNINNQLYLFLAHFQRGQGMNSHIMKYEPDMDVWQQEVDMPGLEDASKFMFCSMKIKKFYLDSLATAAAHCQLSGEDEFVNGSSESEPE